MSSQAPPGYVGTGQGTAGLTDLVTQVQALVRQLSASNTNWSTFISLFEEAFPQITGSFTLTASASNIITQPGIRAGGFPIWVPTNLSAATLEGSAKKLYLSAVTPGASFTLTTASSTPAGTETFSYVVINPA